MSAEPKELADALKDFNAGDVKVKYTSAIPEVSTLDELHVQVQVGEPEDPWSAKAKKATYGKTRAEIIGLLAKCMRDRTDAKITASQQRAFALNLKIELREILDLVQDLHDRA